MEVLAVGTLASRVLRSPPFGDGAARDVRGLRAGLQLHLKIGANPNDIRFRPDAVGKGPRG